MATLTAMMAIALAIAFIVKTIAGLEFSTGWLLATFFVAWFGAIFGTLFSEFPAGDELALMRVGLATFCRIGLPLVAVLVICSYSVRAFALMACAFLGAFYLVGLITGVLLSVLLFNNSDSNSDVIDSSDSSEVDSATV